MTGQLGGWLRGDNEPSEETDVIIDVEIVDGLSDQESDDGSD